MIAADQERLEHTMKKMIALLLAALLVLACAPVALAAPANPFADSTIHVMEIESFDSGYPSGDISQWPGFWSYNVEVQHAPVVGIVDKNGRLAISGCGQDSFLFARAKGAISSSVFSRRTVSASMSITIPAIRSRSHPTAPARRATRIMVRRCSSSTKATRPSSRRTAR